MRGYSGINLSSSCCVRFVRNSEIDESFESTFDKLRSDGIDVVYIDYFAVHRNSGGIVGAISEILKLPHGPHSDDSLWSFLDDLITCSSNLCGLVIVVDTADRFLEQESASFFDLIEAFLVQVHHWQSKTKPCYLCFQLEENLALKNHFK